MLNFLEPINIVHGMYKTDNEPIRLSYHCGVHYNSIIDPWRPTAGHGLGFPDLEPGVHDLEIILFICLIFILACSRNTY
jgi:OTU domain-containing protein 5